MTRAALYARLSRDRSGEETATARQLDDCRAFASARGWEVVGEFSDADVSAYKRNAVRPGYEALLAELDSGGIDVVVSWKLDRLLRRVMDFEKLWERCERQGANVATVRDGIDTSAAMVGVLLPRLMAIFGQLEAEQLSVREQRKHEETAKKGHRSGGGHRPFGLSRDWTELVPDEADLTRDAVARILAGETMYAITAEWNALGVHTPTGRTWSTQLLASMLRSPRLAGLREHRGAIVGPGTWPAIIEPEQHERLRAMFSQRRRAGAPGRFLLSGLVRCERCGSSMTIRRRHKDKRRFYGCDKAAGNGACGGTFIVAEPLEELVAGMVLTALDSPELAASIADRSGAADSAALVAELRADEAALEQVATDHYVERRISRGEFYAARDALELRVESARRRLGQHRAGDALAGLLAAGAALSATWEAADLGRRRSIVGAVVEAVTIGPGDPRLARFDPDRVSVTWRY